MAPSGVLILFLHSPVQISLQASVGYQLEFCEAMWSDFKIKKVKRRFGANNTPITSTSTGVSISANNSSTDLAAEGENVEVPVEQDVVSRKSIGTLCGIEECVVRSVGPTQRLLSVT